MSIDNLFGLPAHPLVVHAAVVLLPLAAIATVAVAAVPRWRRPYAPIALALSLASIGAVWLAEQSGESLQQRVRRSELIHRHTELAEQVMPWAVALAIVAGAIVVIDRFKDRFKDRRPTISGRAVTIVLLVAAAVTATGATWTIAEVGHSGAEATWHDVPSSEGG